MPASAPTDQPASIAHDATRDPANMTPEERRREIAAILARGVLRLRRAAENGSGSRLDRTSEKDSKKISYSLDEFAQRRLHVFDRAACPATGGNTQTHERNA